MSIRPEIPEDGYKELEADRKLIQARVPDQDQRFQFAMDWRKEWPIVIAEGDSWFDYPLIGRDIIDNLGGLTYGCAVKNLAHHGDTLEEILQRAEWIPFVNRWNAKCMIFSGGGNDILGDPLRDILKDGAGLTNWEDAIDENALRTQIDQVITFYERVVGATQAINPDLQILAHGYDYVIPSGEKSEWFDIIPVAGPWLKNVMDEKGIFPSPAETPEVISEERKNIARRLIDRFNEALEEFGDAENNFTHVDLRGTVNEDEWADEIHPGKDGAKKLAGKLMVAINTP